MLHFLFICCFLGNKDIYICPSLHGYHQLLSVKKKLSTMTIATYMSTDALQIAALSPADINFEETLSTLRYGKQCITLEMLE